MRHVLLVLLAFALWGCNSIRIFPMTTDEAIARIEDARTPDEIARAVLAGK